MVHKHDYSMTSLGYVCSHVYYICNNPISEKQSFTSCATALHPKHNKLNVSNIREAGGEFSVATKWIVAFSPAITLLI